MIYKKIVTTKDKKMKLYKSLNSNDDGAAVVEFAIVLPLFMVLTFGIIEFGIIMYNKAIITNASREGARFGILYANPPKSEAAVKERVADKLGTDVDNLGESMLISLGSPAEITISAEPDTAGEYLIVKVEYPYGFLLPKLLPGVPDTMNIVTTTVMRREYQP